MRPDNPVCNKCPSRNTCQFTITNPCGKLRRELERLWAKVDLRIPETIDEPLPLRKNMDEFLSSIHLPFLTWEENICRWLYEYEACTVEEIAGFLGKPESDISRILRSRYQKYHEGVAFKPGKKMLLVKNRDDPHRKILLRVDGYPEKKLGRGRPGKYELRKDYNFLRKYLRKQGKLN